MNKYKLLSKIESLLFYVPYSFIMNVITLVELIFSSSLRFEIRKIKKLKGAYQGKRCFIIGNGPSINKQDLTLLKNEFTFVTNNFILHEKINEINPKFYCIVDPNMYNGKFPVQRLREMEKTLPNTKFFFRYKAKNYIEKNKLFINADVHFLKNDAYLNDLYNFSMSIDKCFPATINVIHTCIILAANMGFTEIYLLGCDSTIFIPKPEHFYKMTDEEKNSTESLEQKLFYSSYMFKSYRILKEYYDKRKISIFNLTEGGVLEIFPRMKYEDIINCNK